MLVTRASIRVRYGRNSVDQLGEELDRLGVFRPLIVHGGSLGRHGNVRDRIVASLGTAASDRKSGWFGGVVAHSPARTVREAAEMLRIHQADGIVAVGGGSAAVTARGAAIVAAEGQDFASLATVRTADGSLSSPRLLAPKVPIVVVPTTPSTAAGKVGTAVAMGGRRYAMFDPKLRAAVIVLDPDLLATPPAELVRAATLNVYAMAAEGLTTLKANPFSDAELSHGLRLVTNYLPRVGCAGEPAELRLGLALAALLVGSGTDTAGGGATAALSHTIGHRYPGLHNGQVDAVLLPHVLDVAVAKVPEHTATLAEIMRVDVAEMPARVRKFLTSVALATRLRDLGIVGDDLAEIAAAAVDDFAATGSPFPTTRMRLVELLQAAW